MIGRARIVAPGEHVVRDDTFPPAAILDAAARRAEVVDLACAVAERVCGEAVRRDPALLHQLVAEALSSLSRAPKVTLVACAEVVSALAPLVGDAPHVELEIDPTAPPDQVRLTSSLGGFELSPARAVEALRVALRRP